SAERRLLRLAVRHLAAWPVLRTRADLPSELAPGGRAAGPHAPRADQPHLREPGPQALLRFAVGPPGVRRRRVPVRPGAREPQAVVRAGRRGVPQPVDAGGRPHPAGGRRRPAVEGREPVEPGRVGARRHPVRERARARAELAAARRVLPWELAGWAILQASRRLLGPGRALPLLA